MASKVPDIHGWQDSSCDATGSRVPALLVEAANWTRQEKARKSTTISYQNLLAAALSTMFAFISVSQVPVLAKSTDKYCPAESRDPAAASLKKPTLAGKEISRRLQSGIASWYGMPFHGRRTASGQIYDMNKLTAAHPTLPLSSRVLVENPLNGKKVVIMVTDRGPYIKNRVIDLSREAARRLGILFRGTAYVNYTVLPAVTEMPGTPARHPDARSTSDSSGAPLVTEIPIRLAQSPDVESLNGPPVPPAPAKMPNRPPQSSHTQSISGIPSRSAAADPLHTRTQSSDADPSISVLP